MEITLPARQNPVLWSAVKAYEHEGLCWGVAKNKRISYARAKSLFKATKQFLYVAMTVDIPCTPSKEIDVMWHEFILHTRDYRAFCEKYNRGQFIDHTPSDRKPDPEGYLRTAHIAGGICDEGLNPDWWPTPPNRIRAYRNALCTSDGSDGNCSGGCSGDDDDSSGRH